MRRMLEKPIQVAVLTLLLGFLLLFLDGWRYADSGRQDIVQVLRVDNQFENQTLESEDALQKQEEPVRPAIEKDPDAKYREDILRRIEGFRNEHTKNGRPEVFGLRGISWLYTNLNGMLLAAPDLERIFEERKVVGGKLNIEIRDVSGKPCDAAKANLVSIYTRIAGPEVMSALAEPVPGECKWIARYEVTIPGAYTILARLLHYNGMQDWGDECRPIQSQAELNETFVEVLHEIPRNHLAFTTTYVCCTMCSRFRECRYSLLGDQVRDSKRWGTGTQCLLFKNSSSDNPNAIRANQVHAKFNNNKRQSLCQTKSRLDEYPNGTVWQLGCGRDQMLLRWAPCGNFGAPEGSSMQATEDIILFEHEHRDLLIDPTIDMPQWTLTLEQAQQEFDAPIGDKRFKPVCDWSKLRIIDFEKGRWTRSPFARYHNCGPLKPFYPTIWTVSPPYPEVDDPICTLRYDLQNINDAPWRIPSNESSYRIVWKTELSESYLIRDPKQFNGPFVPGPWVGYYRLHPSSPCRMPPLRSAKQIRQCFIDRNLTTLALKGDSITWFTEQHLNTLFAAVFPNADEYQYHRDPRTITNMRFNWPKSKQVAQPAKAYMADASVAHLLFETNMTTTIQKLQETARDLGQGFNVKIWNSPPLMLWERDPYLTAPRTLFARDAMRKKFDEHGWYEVDYTTLSAAWTIDATIERDSLHVIAHAMVTLVQLMIDIMCRVPF